MKEFVIPTEQFILGSLLGDGCLVKKSERHNCYMRFKHAANQYEYLMWKYQYCKEHGLLRDDANGVKQVNIKIGSCYANAQSQFSFSTKSMESLNRFKEMTDQEIVDALDVPAFVIWLLDDGNVYKRTSKICCGSKGPAMSLALAAKIEKLLGISTTFYEHPTRSTASYIRIAPRYYKTVEEAVKGYVGSNIDVVETKFPEQEQNESVYVKYHTDFEELKSVGGNRSDWVDLRSAEDVEMKQGEYRIISLGVSMRLPYGFEAHVVPRSSTYKNFGIILANSFGIIDNSYHGDDDVWGFPAIAMRDTVIHKGDRIAQFRIMQRQPRLVFVKVDSLGGENRGGFGSTGVR